MARSSARVQAAVKAKAKATPPPVKASKKSKPKPKKQPKSLPNPKLKANGQPRPKKNGDPPSFKAQLVTDLENTDIIMGRGNKVSTFPGNMRFRYILQPYRTPYQQTESHVEKKRIIREAFVKINGRFLDIASTNRYNANGDRVYDYYTISLERSYEKIAQGQLGAMEQRLQIHPPSHSFAFASAIT
mmetsp:Transcript_22673/g.52131  ORF Transcript_22673/g.52131 Transcript_22673/m.52131 type:complete len:187 (+) Transcript_22673:444-1004(+)